MFDPQGGAKERWNRLNRCCSLRDVLNQTDSWLTNQKTEFKTLKGSHLATGCTFNDTDTLFKRAFYRSLVLLNATIPEVANRDCDFDERSKIIRLEKFKKKLRNLPLNFKNLETEEKTRKDLDQNLEKIARKVNIENAGTKMDVKEKSDERIEQANQSEFEKNELFDSLMRDLLLAMEAGDEASIQSIQQQIDTFETF